MTLIPATGTAPTYAHPGDAGADLIATEEVWITPGRVPHDPHRHLCEGRRV